MITLCNIPGCGREVEVRGQWCYKHYNAGRKDGTIKAITVEDRLWANVDKTDTCWLWTGNINDTGYGRFGAYGKSHRAHRFVYEMLVGPIPAGLELDHLCRVTNCVNPEHLEPVTGYVNTMRSTAPTAINAQVTHCPKGHEYTPTNTYTDSRNMRHCRECGAQNARKYRAQKRVGATA